MNNVWSEHVQGVMTLYLSRKLRFDDLFSGKYLSLFSLDQEKELKILEIGCGPGALAEALHRWYPRAKITGIDRDTNFIEFARENVEGVAFLEGDITALPFPNESFDVVISNTVQEHIEPEIFWNEQRRVLKPGGICLCLSSRRSIQCAAPCLADSPEETEFWNRCPDLKAEMEKYGVGRFGLTEAELPAAMEAHGFLDVTTGYAVTDLTPDDPKYPKEFAERIIEGRRQNDLEAVYRTCSLWKTAEEKEAFDRMLEQINQKHDERLSLFRCGEKQWDTEVNLTMILRGIK